MDLPSLSLIGASPAEKLSSPARHSLIMDTLLLLNGPGITQTAMEDLTLTGQYIQSILH